MAKKIKHMVRRGKEAATCLLYKNDDDDGSPDGIDDKDFYLSFSLGDKVTQGSATNLFSATAKVRRKQPSGTAEEREDGNTHSAPKSYVVKRVRKWRLEEQKKQDLFREVDILRRFVDHPNVVRVHRFYRNDPVHYYLVLEPLAGGELFDRIVKKDNYTEKEARDVCKVLVQVICDLHDRDIVHRDLKPASILMVSATEENVRTTATTTTTKTVVNTTATATVTTTTVSTSTIVTTYNASGSCSSLKLTDFDLARSVVDGPVEGDAGLGEFTGPDEFKAPEMLLGKSHGRPVDMWSLGCLIYFLLCGKHPFAHPDPIRMYLRAAARECEFQAGQWRDISEVAKNFVRQLLTVDPKLRMTASQAKSHAWLHADGQSLEAHDLRSSLEQLKISNTKRKFRAAVKTVLATRLMRQLLAPPAPSVNFFDTFSLGEKIGAGSFGTVFKATRFAGSGTTISASSETRTRTRAVLPAPAPPSPEQQQLQQQEGGCCSAHRSVALGWDSAGTAANSCFAVKRIKKEGLCEKKRLAVINEVSVMRDLNHPNVMSICDFYPDDPHHFFMVLELMEGGELFGRIVKKEYYNEKEARDLCCILLRAVAYIHDQGIVHRDLKPKNLLLACPRDDTSIRIADFGLASSVRDGSLRSFCGTPFYLAPEILKNIPYTTSVDMWSVGVIIYVLLAGYLPFRDRDQRRLFRSIRAGQFRFHDKYWSEVSEEAKDLIKRLLTVDPKARITAREACEHPWLSTDGSQLSSHDLSASLGELKVFNATRKFRAAGQSVLASRALANGLGE